MEPPKSALERLQGAFWLLNALIKRDDFFWSEKGSKKSCGTVFGTRRLSHGLALYIVQTREAMARWAGLP